MKLGIIDAVGVGCSYEHGTSEVFLWSSAQVGGVPVEALPRHRGETREDVRPVLEKAVRDANIAIIEGNDASQHGIGIASIRIAEMIFADERAAIPIESFQKKFGVTLSLSNTVDRSGIHEVLEPELSEDECR